MFFSAALKCCKERGWFSWENWEGWNWWNLKVSTCWCFCCSVPYLYSPMMALNGSIQSLSNCKEWRPKFGYLCSLKKSKDLHVTYCLVVLSYDIQQVWVLYKDLWFWQGFLSYLIILIINKIKGTIDWPGSWTSRVYFHVMCLFF